MVPQLVWYVTEIALAATGPRLGMIAAHAFRYVLVIAPVVILF